MSREKEIDAKIAVLKAEVEKRRRELATIERPNFKTNLSFYIENKLHSQNLQVAKPEELVCIAALVESLRESYARINKTLMTDPICLVIGGFAPEDWLHDISLKLKKLEVTTKREQLNALEKRLNGLMSPEKKAELELADIVKQLG